MIVKPYEQCGRPSDPRQQAGVTAERQMAHYLHRSFSEDPDVFVLHGLRLEDPDQPEHDGSAGVCQIDHLLVHRFGFFIIESKAVSGEVRVRPDGSGGDEWTRVWGSRETGMPSPIRQAELQRDFLRAFLQRNREDLLGRFPVGLRTIGRFIHGTDQQGFKRAPIQLIVAVSDGGMIKRLDEWKEPQEPFRMFVTKADLVPAKMSEELERHRQGAKSNKRRVYGDYGSRWRMEEQEAEQVAGFLAERHIDRSGASPARRAHATCRHCGSKDLTARKRYSFYWKCNACQANTPMPTECSACGACARRDKQVQIRKDGSRYLLNCQRCGSSEPIWM
ncbi:MAG: nuclease-related domain-containing protein [bacterium]|nr:nuclease-related domain-containing protein [bacterium]